MRVDSTNFANLNGAKNRFPRQVVRIDFSGSGDYVYFSSHTGITGLTGDVFHGYLKDFKGTSQKLNNASGISSIGNLNFGVVDIDKDITNKIKTKLSNKKGLRNKEVVLFQGYKDLDFSDFIELQTQNIDRNVSFKDNVYKFNCSDIQRNLKFEIFKLNETKLARSLPVGQMYFYAYDDGLEFCTHGANYGDAPNQTVAYMQLNKEVMRISSIVADSSLGEDLFKYTIAERGVFRTDPQAHNFDETTTDTDKRPKIKEVVYMEMPFPKMIYAILTGTLYNQAGSSFPSNWSINLGSSKINLSDFLNIGNDWWDFNDDNNGKHLRFIGEKASEAKTFLEEQILQPHLAFLHVYGDGTLGLKRSSSVLYDAPYVAALNIDNIVSYSPLVNNLNKTINRVRVKWDYDFLDGETQRGFVLLDRDSITTHLKSPIKTFSYRGIYPASHTYSTLKVMFDALRDRISNPPLTFQVDVFASLNRLQVGDVVQVDLAQIRDYSGNTTDLKRSFEIQGVTFKPKSGVITLQLYGTSAKSEPIQNLDGAPVFTSGFYSSKGTNLNTLAGSTFDSGSNTLTLNSSVKLTGTSNMNDALSTWFCETNLEIASTSVITIENNVCFKVKGFFDNSLGKIDGKGGGLAGGIGQYTDASAASTTGGFFGAGEAQGGFGNLFALQPPFSLGLPSTPYTVGSSTTYSAKINAKSTMGGNTTPDKKYNEVPSLHLEYDGADSLLGIPNDMRGTGGAGGLGFPTTSWYTQGGATEKGGDGGNGGAAFLLISRGAETGDIDLSGINGKEGVQPNTVIYDGKKAPVMISGSGMGGISGAFYTIIDGSDNLIPNVLDGFISSIGESPNSLRNNFDFSNTDISADASDNSLNSVSGQFSSIVDNKWVLVSGFAASANNGWFEVITATPYKIILNTSITNAGASLTISIKSHRYDSVIKLNKNSSPDVYGDIYSHTAYEEDTYTGVYSFFEGSGKEDESQSRYRIQYAPINYVKQENAKYAKRVTTLTAVEYKNTPKTALGNVSTIEVSIGIPTDTGFSHANIYYRLFGTNEWLYVDSTRTSATFTAVSDGLIYEIMARAVSWVGIENDGGVFSSIQISDLSTDVDQEVLGVPNVSGLEIDGQGNNFEFTGKECKLVWRKSSLNEWYNLGYEPLSQGSGAGGEDLYFKDYKIEVYNISTGNLIRTEYVKENFYTYTFEKNAEDNNGVAIRTFRIEVKQRSRINILSLVPSKIIPINPEPDLPTNVEIKSGWGQITVSFDTPKDLDYEGLVLYLDKSSTGLIDDSNKLTFQKSGGLNETFKLIEEPNGDSIVAETSYYISVGAFDSFGEDNPNLSTTFLVKTNKSAEDKLNGVSPWAKVIDPADRDFISKYLASDAIESEKIINLTAAKITTGILHATTQITCEGLIKTIGNSGYELTMGLHSITGTDYVFSFGNGVTYPILIDADGNSFYSGDLNAAGGTFTGDLSAAGGTFTGDLSAAGGTFSGSISAASGTFTGDLQASTYVTATGAVKRIEINPSNDNEIHFYGDNGAGTSTIEELIQIGINVYDGDQNLLVIGKSTSRHRAIYAESFNNRAIQAKSNSDAALWGNSTSGYGVYARSSSSVGVYGSSASGVGVDAFCNFGTGLKALGTYGAAFSMHVTGAGGLANMRLVPLITGVPATSAGDGSFISSANGKVYYRSGATWKEFAFV